MTERRTATRFAWVESPVGRLLLTAEGGFLATLFFAAGGTAPPAGALEDPGAPPLPEATRQLGEYFARARTRFELPLAPQGTAFQRAVWDALLAIPYGATETYAGLARRLGNPSAIRAVGRANGSNPISIVIPCHRVIGSGGALVGYGGSLPVKAALLELEGARLPLTPRS